MEEKKPHVPTMQGAYLDFMQLPFEYGRFPGVGLYPAQQRPLLLLFAFDFDFDFFGLLDLGFVTFGI